MKNNIEAYFKGSLEVFENFKKDENIKNNILELVDNILNGIQKEKKILIVGNGGSAADAQHLAAEFVVRYQKNRIPLPALALTTDTSVLTATGNDYSFEDIFARQIDALGNNGDILILFSTSGKSKNIIKACRIAKQKNLKNFLFTGSKKFDFGELIDLEINIPSNTTSYIQECHLKLIHLICFLIDQQYNEKLINYD